MRDAPERAVGRARRGSTLVVFLLALVVFATWHPGRVIVGAYLFGGVTMLQLFLQARGVAIAPEGLSMLPYLATIVVLALLSRDVRWIRVHMPASLGKPFDAGQ